MANDEWMMGVHDGLSAHFKCPDGKSRPGTHWSIGLKRGDKTYTAMVKGLLADDASQATRADTGYQSRTCMDYLFDRLSQGWHPDQQEDHLIYITNPRGAPADPAAVPAPAPAAKPWWKLW
ncbi:hypothetical protein BWI17_11485 [Betaproteobacteria bacterium GR16-43]|nr:hypothetical protein BWI17_11485 [Betaproteobacteria bacterium GR16-43]